MTETTGRVFTLGVAGGSGSGKSTLTRRLIERVGSQRVAFLAHDSYYHDLQGVDPAGHNFDHPDALETSLLVEHLRTLRRGEAVEVPLYDFASHSRTGRSVRVEPRPVIIVEGILLFVEAALREQLDLRLFLDVDADVRLARRVRRDVAERGRSHDDVLRQYEATVRPMHHQFVQPSKRWAHVVLPRGGQDGPALELLVAQVECLLREAPSDTPSACG